MVGEEIRIRPTRIRTRPTRIRTRPTRIRIRPTRRTRAIRIREIDIKYL
jgi:hypothetical protein